MTVYVKPGCGWCVEALDWLRSQGIAHEVRDVFADQAAFTRMREISGQTRAPTLEMPDGSVLADFGVDELREFLASRGSNR
jgi:glutaredoxin 3